MSAMHCCGMCRIIGKCHCGSRMESGQLHQSACCLPHAHLHSRESPSTNQIYRTSRFIQLESCKPDILTTLHAIASHAVAYTLVAVLRRILLKRISFPTKMLPRCLYSSHNGM